MKDGRRLKMMVGGLVLAAPLGGCIQPGRLAWHPVPASGTALSSTSRDIGFDQDIVLTRSETPGDRPQVSAAPLPADASAVEISRADASGAMALDACIRAALDGNAAVRAARFNVESLRQRIPQVTALDDPILSNSIFPIPSAAPQYSLMGYMPYGALLAQQFPWCGTLRLRGAAAEHDVRIALFELAATELDAVAAVKRAYFDLHYAERAEALLIQNRKLAGEFLEIARARYPTATASQADVLRSEVAVTDIDREIENNRAALADARAELARVMHSDRDDGLRTDPALNVAGIPESLDQLYQLALNARPDLQGRLAAVGRDEAAVALARKRYYPNVTVGVLYQDMEKTNAMMPETAGGMPNVGLFVGMNLPVYRKRIAAGVCEAQARASADRALYEAERDQSRRDIKGLHALARSQQNILAILRRSNLPAARQMLRLTSNEYRSNVPGVDFLTVAAAWRELLQVELQLAQSEAELGKTLASLERGVGVQLNDGPAAAAAPVGNEARP